MTFEEAKQFLEKHHEGEYLKDEKGFFEGINILNKYVEKWGYNVAAEHDIIYLPGDVEKMTEEDILKLYRLGFHLDSDGEGWAYFT